MDGVFAIALFNWPDFLGPFHVVMLHYPIGFLSLAVLLEIWAIRHPSDPARRAVGFTLGLSVVVSWIATILGLLRAAHGEFDTSVLTLHKFSGIAVAILSTVTWFIHRRLYPDPQRIALRRSYRSLLALSMACLMVAGHEGGSLTHGSKFLTAGAPSSVSGLIGGLEAALPTVSSSDTPGDVYTSRIQPLLERKCYGCHGPEKQKGHLRLDERVTLLSPGETGMPAVVPGDPMQSQLVKLILLPRDHDDVMPPSGKEPLTPEESLAVIHWIQAGANFGARAHP